MRKYIIRLDDACERRNINKWNRIEYLLDKYHIKPLVGIVPNCEDSKMKVYPIDVFFWERVSMWISKGWLIAMHGYNHVYSTNSGGLNPVNNRSEFAGLDLSAQKHKVRRGIAIMRQHNINPQIFFAPAHTFDENTLEALKAESDIKIISDTIAYDSYKKLDFTFVPVQAGTVRRLPFCKVTFCYHPNAMQNKDFYMLEKFLVTHQKNFISFPMEQSHREYSIVDRILNYVYMRFHK